MWTILRRKLITTPHFRATRIIKYIHQQRTILYIQTYSGKINKNRVQIYRNVQIPAVLDFSDWPERVINLQVEMHVYGTLPVQTDNELRGTIFYENKSLLLQGSKTKNER